VSGGIYYNIVSHPYKKVIAVVVLYFISLCVLLAYALTTFFHTNFGVIGVINAACVVSIDIVVYMLIYITKDIQVNPVFNALSSLIARICIIAFSGSLWFLGYCLLYLLLIIYIATLIVNKHYPKFEKLPTVDIRKVNILKLPEVAGLFLLMLFGGLIFYIGN